MARSQPGVFLTIAVTFAAWAFLVPPQALATPTGSGADRSAATAPHAIRFVVPNAPMSNPGERDLPTLVEEYNQVHRPAGTPIVQLVRRGDNFSSLKELIALFLAGDPPEIAAIESSELPALERTRLAKPIPQKLVDAAGGQPGSHSIPFQHSLPILVADQEVLYRIHADQLPFPRTWDEVGHLAARIAETGNPTAVPLSIPLQGPRGLWIFEAIAARPLWTREPGGLKTNRTLEPAIRSIQSLLPPHVPTLATAEMSWDRALQDFLDRKTPMVVTTLDALPLISLKASFRWKSGILPTFGRAKPVPMESGSDLVVTQDSPGVWAFLEYLYSAPVSKRWIPSGGFMPIGKRDASAPHAGVSPAYLELVKAARSHKERMPRSTDSDVVRAHTEWVSALHLLFGEPAKRQPTETIFTQLDAALAP